MSSDRQRMPLIDAAKAVASQLIVLHHLAFYGPMSDWTHQFLPDTMEWLSRHGRLAVQVFLVISGFLAIKALAPKGVLLARKPWGLLRKRYLSVAGPYVVALFVAMACASVASHWMSHDSIPGDVAPLQFLAHVTLLNGVLDVDSISAGVWYVAIDFQLFGLLLAVLWLGRAVAPRLNAPGAAWPTVGLTLALAAASLLVFNLNAGLDNWAIYFFGSYALGVAAYWAGNLYGRWGRGVVAVLMAGLTLAALFLAWRVRIAVAMATAVCLLLAHAKGWLYTWPRSRVLSYLGRISYGVFLMNFPIALVVNGWFTRYGAAEPRIQTIGVLAAWLGAVLAGALFYHLVESPLRKLGAQPDTWARLRLRLATILPGKTA